MFLGILFINISCRVVVAFRWLSFSLFYYIMGYRTHCTGFRHYISGVTGQETGNIFMLYRVLYKYAHILYAYLLHNINFFYFHWEHDFNRVTEILM